MRMNDIDYRDDAVICRGFIAYDDTASSKRPGVLVFHEGLGLGEHIVERARRVAKLGYVALAADMFGDRRQARDLEDMRGLVGDLRNEPTKLRARGRAALATLASLPQVDAIVHGQRPEGVHWRLLTWWERQLVITFAAVERLTVAIDACDWIRRFRGIVAVYAGLRGGSAHQPVAIVMGAVAR